MMQFLSDSQKKIKPMADIVKIHMELVGLAGSQKFA